jgi:hypothetical protein
MAIWILETARDCQPLVFVTLSEMQFWKDSVEIPFGPFRLLGKAHRGGKATSYDPVDLEVNRKGS